jgi:hypothetical protein
MQPNARAQMIDKSKTSRAMAIGLGFAGFHAALVFVFLAVQGLALGGESRLVWVLWLPIDFPISLLVGLGFDLIPEFPSIYKTIRIWWPHIVHGIFGTIWWFMVPFVVVRALERRRAMKPPSRSSN